MTLWVIWSIYLEITCDIINILMHIGLLKRKMVQSPSSPANKPFIITDLYVLFSTSSLFM